MLREHYAAELKRKLEPVFQAQGNTLKDLIDRMADMNDEDLAALMKRLAKEIDEEEAGDRF